MPEHEGGRLVLVVGAQAVGKTSVAAALARRLPRAVHVDGDAVQGFVVSGAAPYSLPPSDAAEEQLGLRHEGAVLLGALYAGAGFDALVSDSMDDGQLTAVVNRALELADRVHVVVLDADADVVAARDRARLPTGDATGLTAQGRVDAVRSDTPRIGLWVDTSALTLDRTVSSVLDGLDDARVHGAEVVGVPTPGDAPSGGDAD